MSFSQAQGQSKNYLFRHITSDDGLSNSQVSSILQDYRGFVWIGTYSGGINRFDGNNFIIYKNDPEDSSTIVNNTAKAIFEDHKKRLFIGTYEGLSLYNRDKDCFVNYQKIKSSTLYKFLLPVFRITEDHHGNMWLATSNGLVCYNHDANTKTHYLHDIHDSTSLCDNFLENVCIDKKYRIWLSSHKGLDVMDGKTRKISHVTWCKSHKKHEASLYQSSAVEDFDGTMWFGTNDGLLCIENADLDSLHYIHYKNNPTDPTSLSHNYVISLYLDKDNHLWVGTENGGLNLFDRKTKIFTRFLTDDFNPKSLNNQSIFTIMQDLNHNLWVGTHGGGLNISVKNSDFILHYKNLPGAPQGLGNNIVNAFLEDKTGLKWVATDGGGLNLFEQKTGHFIRYNTSNSTISSDATLALLEGDNDDLWIGTWAGGLVNFRPGTNTFTSYMKKNSPMPDDNVHAIAKDSIGNLWLGTQNGGLIHFFVKENKFVVFSQENSKLKSNRVSVIRIDSKGRLYLGATNNMQVFLPGESRFISYQMDTNNVNSLSCDAVVDILIQHDTCVWIATRFGLNQFNPITKNFKRYFVKDGLPSNQVYGLTLDKNNILWVSTNYGISRFDYKHNTFKNLTKSDGLQGNEFADKSIYTASDGTVMAGGKNGFNVIDPVKIHNNTRVPDVIITGFSIFNNPVTPLSEKSPLEKQISETKEITISYKQSVLTFYFSVIDFTNPLRNEYAYMMENFDEKWNYSGNKREATYTNLSPGTYVFRVKGSNNNGVWNEKGTALIIHITPPWWKTTIAICSFIIIIIGSFLGFYFYRVNHLRKQKELLEKLVDERTIELAQKNQIVHQANILLKEHQKEIEAKNEMLIEQADKLSQTNTLLEERQIQVEKQSEELLTQAEELFDKNAMLTVKTQELNLKNEMLVRQADELNEINALLEERQMQIEEQSEELIAQKEELQIQRDHLFELNATKDKLFSIIGHDLRNPFTAILGYSELLLLKFKTYTPDKLEQHLGFIKGAAHDTLTLLNTLLEWSKAQRGILHVEVKEQSLVTILENELKVLSQQGAQKDVQLLKSVVGSEYLVEADTNIISTVIRNLTSNAIKFSKKNSSVYLTLNYEHSRHVVFSVKDNGVGMSEEKLKTLFDTTKNTSTRGTAGEKGTGLGLLLCYDFIDKHGGKIWVESVENEGSTFYFSIPSRQQYVE